jgi:hypothetical protein
MSRSGWFLDVAASLLSSYPTEEAVPLPPSLIDWDAKFLVMKSWPLINSPRSEQPVLSLKSLLYFLSSSLFPRSSCVSIPCELSFIMGLPADTEKTFGWDV